MNSCAIKHIRATFHTGFNAPTSLSQECLILTFGFLQFDVNVDLTSKITIWSSKVTVTLHLLHYHDEIAQKCLEETF